MFVINHKKIFFGIAILLVLASIFLIVTEGFNLGIDFTGGSLTEVSYTSNDEANSVVDIESSIEGIRSRIDALDLGVYTAQPVGDTGLIVRTRDLTDQEHSSLLASLEIDGSSLNEERFASIGPTIGNELRRKAYVAIIIVVALIILFIAWAFRKSGKEVSSWLYGVIAIIALVHDIIIPAGIFTLLGHIYGGFEVDALFVTAILAILGYSVNDTIVVFDRVRENLIEKRGNSFNETVGMSLTQTMARSINTSLTTLLVLFALYFIGGESTKDFSLVLILGIIAGTYSSIFLAAPLLTVFHRKNK